MRMRRIWLALMLASTLAWAQQDSSPAPAVALAPDSEEIPASAQPLVPANLTDQMPPPAAGIYEDLDNLLQLSLKAGVGYVSNVNGSGSGDEQYTLMPSIRFKELRSRGGWDLQYNPGIYFYQHSTETSQFSNSASGTGDYNFTDRFHVRVRQDYFRATEPFAAVENSLPSLGVLNGANPTIVAWGYTKYTTNASLDYALTEHSKIGVSGTWNEYDHDNQSYQISSSIPLMTQNNIGSLYYSQQLSARNTVGLQGGYTEMSFPSSQNTRAYSVSGSATILLNAHSSIMLYGGPQFTQNRYLTLTLSPVLTSTSTWGPLAGIVYGWTGNRTSVQVEIAHKIGDGAGSLQAFEMTTGTIRLTRRITQFWTAHASATAGDNIALSSNGYGRLRTLLTTVGMERKLSGNLSGRLDYSGIYQQDSAYPVSNYSRVQFALTYAFRKPMGN